VLFEHKKPRTAQQKSDLMQHVTAQLHQELNIPEQDVMFVIVQNSAEVSHAALNLIFAELFWVYRK
jgi:phenylpyruvate tautomerase PptA (4-oxalocrotonate tautomerase family)